MLSIFRAYDKKGCIKNTLDKDFTETEEEALIEIYKKLRPGEPPTVDSSRNLINSLFFNPKRYDFGKVGRYKIDQKLMEETDKDILNKLKAINSKMGIDTNEKYILNCKDIFLNC